MGSAPRAGSSTSLWLARWLQRAADGGVHAWSLPENWCVHFVQSYRAAHLECLSGRLVWVLYREHTDSWSTMYLMHFLSFYTVNYWRNMCYPCISALKLMGMKLKSKLDPTSIFPLYHPLCTPTFTPDCRFHKDVKSICRQSCPPVCSRLAWGWEKGKYCKYLKPTV